MLITLMFLVFAVKSRTFSSFLYSAKGQVCRSWEGAWPDRQPGWPVEMFYIMDVMLSLGMGVGQGAGTLFSMSFNCLLFFSLFREFALSVSSNFYASSIFLFCEFGKFCKIHEFG